MTSPLFYFPLPPVSLAGRSSALEEENSSTRPTSSSSSPPGCGRAATARSRRFRQLFHAHTVVQSFSNSWRPHDNAVAEPFSATLKQEELYRKDYTSEADFKQCLASCIEYIELYNTQRPHRTLKNRIPCRVEEAFMNSKSGGAVC